MQPSPLHALRSARVRGHSAAIALTLLACTAACADGMGGDGGKACTLIGCVDMLTIQPKTPQGSVIALVQGTLVIDGATFAVQCFGDNIGVKADAPSKLSVQCSDQGLQIFGTPSKVVVTLSSGDYAISGAVIEPSYKTSQPNGPDCDPICKQATVAVTLGGGLVDTVGDVENDAGGDAAPLDGTAQDGADAGGGGDGGGNDGGAADGGGGGEDSALDASDAGPADIGQDAGPADISQDAGSADGGEDAGKGCCASDGDCPQGHCISGVCYETKMLQAGTCWLDADCASDQQCQGAITCPCGAQCFAADKPGTCQAKAPGEVCCDSNGACPSGMVCAKSTCKPTKDLGAKQCWTAAQCGSSESCEGAKVCSCLAMCPLADAPGMCKAQGGGCVVVKNGDFGMCDMVMGVAFDGAKCVTLSGCGCKDACAGVYKSVAECEAACP